MNELIAKINDLSAALVADAELQAEKGKQSSRYSCAKLLWNWKKCWKEFRKNSFGRIKKIEYPTNTCSKRGCIYQEPDNWAGFLVLYHFNFIG